MASTTTTTTTTTSMKATTREVTQGTATATTKSIAAI
jgi:hypothetical protein